MWLAGAGPDNASVQRGWQRLKRWFSELPQAQRSTLMATTCTSPLVVDGSCHAALMYASVAPTITKGDMLTLAVAMVGHDGDTEDLRVAREEQGRGGLCRTVVHGRRREVWTALYEIGFGSAAERGLLSDYKVIVLAVLAVPEDAAARSVQRSLARGGELMPDDAAKMIGCWRALAKIDEDEFGQDTRPMRRAIAFCRSIDASRLVETNFARAADEYRRSNAQDVDLRSHECEVKHVDGTFKSSERDRELAWLGDDAGEGACRVLTNARCLAEGVDVPALDAILFMHPRKSQIDIVQAVGRVMRKAEGKTLGYVILPVVVPAGVPATLR